MTNTTPRPASLILAAAGYIKTLKDQRKQYARALEWYTRRAERYKLANNGTRYARAANSARRKLDEIDAAIIAAWPEAYGTAPPAKTKTA